MELFSDDDRVKKKVQLWVDTCPYQTSVIIVEKIQEKNTQISGLSIINFRCEIFHSPIRTSTYLFNSLLKLVVALLGHRIVRQKHERKKS